MRGTTALLVRSVRNDSRSMWTYAMRLALAGVIFAWLLMAVADRVGRTAPGEFLFSAVAVLNLSFITLAGLSLFASSVAEEKEDGTIGLLRMTDLNALSILLGKAGSRLFQTLLLLAAQLPFTMLAIALGGVDGVRVIAVYIALGAYTLMLCNYALLMSVIARKTSEAAAYVFVSQLVFIAIPALLYLVASLGGVDYVFGSMPKVQLRVQQAIEYLFRASPITRMYEILSVGFDGNPLGFFMWVNIAAAGVFFVLAWVLFERMSLRSLDGDTAGKKKSADGKERPTRPRTWPNAMAWKSYQFGMSGRKGMAIQTIVMLTFVAIIVGIVLSAERGRLSADDWREVIGGSTFFAGLVVLLVEGVLVAGRALKNESRDNAWSSLVLLPRSVPAIIYNALLGYLPTAVMPMLFMIIGCVLEPEPIEELARDLDEVWPYFLATHYLLFLHLVLYLSLWMKWGATPAAVAIEVLLHITCGIGLALSEGAFGYGSEDAIFVMIVLMEIVAMIGLNVAVCRRVTQLAAK